MENPNQQINSVVANNQQNVAINAGAFGAKYKSKGEIYRWLTSEAAIYLPPYESVTVFHMRDICGGKRKMIKQANVKVISVPFFDGLSIEHMLNWAKTRPEGVMEALPVVKREVDKLPRAYIANCIYTLTGDAFKTWINK